MTETFICECCEEEHPRDWSDEDTLALFEQDFPGEDVEGSMVVCFDCYEAIKLMREKILAGEWVTMAGESPSCS